jgi:hypothetical protein
MRTVTIEPAELPQGSLAAALAFTDYVDAYRVELDASRFPDVDAFAGAFLGAPPSWVRTLMRARDGAMGALGFKRTDARRQSAMNLAPGGQAGIFRVFDRTEREIVLGEDDRHLDFRLSLYYAKGDAAPSATVVTLVRFNNAFGRVYFAPVAPIHRRVVAAMMRQAVAPRAGGERRDPQIP